MLLRGILLCLAGVALIAFLLLQPRLMELVPSSEPETSLASSPDEEAMAADGSSVVSDTLFDRVVAADAFDDYTSRESYCLWPGDILSDIAAAAGVTVDAILDANPDYTGYAGSTIHLPSGSTPPHEWTTSPPIVPTIQELPFGISGYYLSYDNRSKQVALSFDIGYVPENHDLMRWLASQGIRATFLVLGDPVSRYPEIVEQILDNGHELGNHSFTHENMLPHSRSDIGAELRLTEKVVQEARAGVTTKPLFRAPFGAINPAIVQVARDEGYHVVGWTIDSRDWTEEITAEAIYAQVTENVCPGAIVALHDVNPASKVAIPRIVEYLRRNGYTFATVSELIFPPQGS